MLRTHFALLAICSAVVFSGCASVKTSNTARTAKEQLLISNSIDRSLNKINFQPVQGQRVFLEEKYMDSVDKSYAVASVRHRILREGGMIANKVEDADVVMEIRSGGIGTDTAESYVGIPEIVLPGMITLPEVRFLTKSSQEGFAKIGLVAYDAKSNQVLGDGGVTSAKSDDNNLFVLGVGPFQSGSLKEEKAAANYHRRGAPYKPLPNHVALEWRQSGESGEPGHSPYQYASEHKESDDQ